MSFILVAADPSDAWSDGRLTVASSERESQCRDRSARGALAEPGESCWPQGPGLEAAVEGPARMAEARTSLRQAQALTDAGKLADAVVRLRSAEQHAPSVVDRIAVRRGELLLALNEPQQACEAFAIAQSSLDSGVALRAQIGAVLCALEAGDKNGEALLQALLDQYPNLTKRGELELALAVAREGWGDRRGAAALLRRIDLEDPTSPTAARARRELVRLQRLGVRREPYSWRERVQRAERVLRSGPIELAAAEVAAMRPLARSNPGLRAQVELLTARIARIRGRFGHAEPTTRPTPPSEARLKLAGSAASKRTASRAKRTPERIAFEAKVLGIRAKRPTARLKDAQVLQLFELASEARDKALCREMLDAARSRRSFEPAKRFDMAVRATGVADDVAVLAMLHSLLDVAGYEVKALYHHARALERLGRVKEAEREYHGVIRRERQATRYYTMWSKVRLMALREQPGASCPPNSDVRGATLGRSSEGCSDTVAKPSAVDHNADREGAVATESQADRESSNDPLAHAAPASHRPAALASNGAAAAAARPSAWKLLPHSAQRITAALEDARASAELAIEDPEQLRGRCLQLLTPLAAAHGQAYPWLPRARQLIELDRFGEASEELSEAYMAWRDATGAYRMRMGLVPLLTGSPPPPRPLDPTLRDARIALDLEARIRLGQVATLLGDPGIAFDVGSAAETKPRAYAELVEAAAQKHGLDPDLLFAVMRVESAFNRRVQSHAGAVGLMQIMPRTGSRIALSIGVDDFEPSQLLRPERNIEFSAWYLASLLERFDGRLPLAIASYNGGPHNVRLWMRNNPPDMPLDAFLERIPFKETHRYVRKVLSFYALYRAEKTLPVGQLSVVLPKLGPDAVAF